MDMDAADIALWHALYDLEVRHWREVNVNNGRRAHELYVETGVFAVGNHRHEGRDVIRDFYIARAQRGARTARHVVSNFSVRRIDAGRATAIGIVSNFAADGTPPLPSKPAALLADMANEYRRAGDGAWRYVSHILTPVFAGDDSFVNAAVKKG